jgi:putative Ca2+/H+ antiporter (TMEM165/GDT1 family)
LGAFWLSLFVIFIAELGDKTQLVALSLATQFNAKVVLAGIFFATLLVHVFSVLIGVGAGTLLPANWINFAAGLAFIGFGMWTLRGDSLEDENGAGKKVKSPFMLVAITFFLAELGDKTMLSTITLATDGPFIPVWIGSTLGMVLSDGLAIIAGMVMGKNLPERAIKIGAACIFFAFGIYKTLLGAVNLPPLAWILGVAVIGIVYHFMFRTQSPAEESAVHEKAEVA